MASGIHKPFGRLVGGIVALVELVDAHRGAFEYDWRARFHLPLTVLGRSMPWGEAVRLTRQLSRDWSTAVGAAIGGWDYPMDRAAIVLADLYDLQHATKSKRKITPYPRPWDSDRRKTYGNKTSLTIDKLRSVLAAHRKED